MFSRPISPPGHSGAGALAALASDFESSIQILLLLVGSCHSSRSQEKRSKEHCHQRRLSQSGKVHNPSMSDSSFPDQLYEAAKIYTTSCNAYASFRAGGPPGSYIALRMQAPEIMMQFVGDVDIGKDPEGRLFYQSNIKWPTGLSTYTIFYYRNSHRPAVVVRVDFYEADKDGKLTPFARFLTNIKAPHLPPIVPGLGQGRWNQLEAVTCPILLNRISNTPTINLGARGIQKQAHFTSPAKESIAQTGFLFFRLLARLKTQPDGNNNCVADYSSDRIVFHIEDKPSDVVALFIPTKPLKEIGQGVSRVTWEDLGQDLHLE